MTVLMLCFIFFWLLPLRWTLEDLARSQPAPPPARRPAPPPPRRQPRTPEERQAWAAYLQADAQRQASKYVRDAPPPTAPLLSTMTGRTERLTAHYARCRARAALVEAAARPPSTPPASGPWPPLESAPLRPGSAAHTAASAAS